MLCLASRRVSVCLCARVLARASVSSRGEGVACECVEGKSQSVSEKQRSTTSEEPDSTSVAKTFMLWLVRLFYPAFYATKPWIIPKVQILFLNHKQG
ncbi:Protein Sprouty-like 3 [Manis pentadactyla]|nr:Protein Sprouty-like 3 [Manis pentadactyla]